MHQLAIVIPVFKSSFFGACLESIWNQTDGRFSVYVGNDASNDTEIDRIIEKYKDKINITYIK
jgi:glycosyltransferase involved in cell wall biosynthesis